jgi:hypothetical protein
VSGWAAAPEVVKAAPKRRVAKAVAPKADEAEPAHDDEAAGADAGPEVVQAALADQADVGPDGSAGRSEEEA